MGQESWPPFPVGCYDRLASLEMLHEASVLSSLRAPNQGNAEATRRASSKRRWQSPRAVDLQGLGAARSHDVISSYLKQLEGEQLSSDLYISVMFSTV